MDEHQVIGVDIGGSHITAGIADLISRKLVEDTLIRKHVNSKGNAEEILDAWAQVIDQLFSVHPLIQKKIGIAMPGPFDYETGICLIKGVDKFESLFGLNIKKLLSEKLRIKDDNILMMNDASCFLKGEVFGGAAIDCNNVIGITLGTGLGSARFQNGKIFEGHLYCSSFKDGMAENYLSSRWFLKKYKEVTDNVAKNVQEVVTRVPVDPLVTSLFLEFGKNLGEVLSVYAKKYSCETIIIGGNISNAWDLFSNETLRILNRANKNILIKKARLGEEGALIGAASLWE